MGQGLVQHRGVWSSPAPCPLGAPPSLFFPRTTPLHCPIQRSVREQSISIRAVASSLSVCQEFKLSPFLNRYRAPECGGEDPTDH